MPYDFEHQLYVTSNGVGPIPVLVKSETDMLQHLCNPIMFGMGMRMAVCNQNIELNWCVAIRPSGPLPICLECVRIVEDIPA